MWAPQLDFSQPFQYSNQLMDATETKAAAKPQEKVWFPFGIRLAAIVTLILMGSIWAITTLMSMLVSSEFVRTAESTNFDINSRAAAGVRERLYGMRSLTLQLLDMNVGAANATAARQARNIFFERNPGIAAVTAPGVFELINRQFFTGNEIPLETLSSWLSGETDTIDRASRGEPVLLNVSPTFGTNLLAMFYPWQGSGQENAAVVLFSPENLAEIIGIGSSSTVLVNNRGDVLIHPDFNQVFSGANIASSPLLEALWGSSGESVRLSYTERGNRFVGAGHRVPFANAAVFSFQEYSVITEQIAAATRRNMLLSVTVMFLTVLVTWFFARSIVTQIKKLIDATGSVALGEFALDLKPASRDEIGLLTEHFVSMGRGLGKREEAKALVGRYNDHEVTDRVIAGEFNLQGVYREAAILSVDFVSFEDSSSGLDAGEALELLNFFIAKIANCVEKTGGVVDKIIGTRMVAHWGILAPGDIAEKVMCSLRSALMMRTDIWDINTDFETQGKAQLRMACGIHTGQLLAGNIGMSHNKEYSAAGNVLAMAGVAEKACASANVDIVITQAVHDLAGRRILAEALAPDSGAGLFGLVNVTPSSANERQRWPFTLTDVRDSLGRGSKTQAAKE